MPHLGILSIFQKGDRYMIITMLEASIPLPKKQELINNFSKAIAALDEGIIDTYLIANTKSSDSFRILTIWKDKEALEKMRQSTSVPRGVQLFREIGVEPSLTVFSVEASGHK